jgi:exodeoxyribonuclease VII large subunit
VAKVDAFAGRHSGAIGRLFEERSRELRAATRNLPTVENVLAIPRRSLDEAAARLGRSLTANVLAHRALLSRAAGRLSIKELLRAVERHSERLVALTGRNRRALALTVERRSKRLEALDQILRSLSYTRVLARGFAVIRDAADVPIASAADISAGDALNIEFRDGRVGALATASPPAKRKSRKPEGGPQGDLF